MSFVMDAISGHRGLVQMGFGVRGRQVLSRLREPRRTPPCREEGVAAAGDSLWQSALRHGTTQKEARPNKARSERQPIPR